MQSSSSFVYLIFILVALGTGIVHGEPEPMARPTRPKVFTSPEELRRYLDLVRDYYSLNGKARYGKRADAIPSIPEENHPWDALRTILEIRRQMQQQKLEKGRQEKEQFLREFENPESSRHASRIGSRPSYVYDVVGKYYDDLQ